MVTRRQRADVVAAVAEQLVRRLEGCCAVCFCGGRSATGQKKVSLFALSALQDIAFAMRRAESRLVEMQSEPYKLAHAARMSAFVVQAP